MAKLSLVGTPIGNLEDITLRALRVLQGADLVLCEDTRVTRKLLSHYKITTPVESFHEHSSQAKIDRILGLLRAEKNIALTTDAGTPGVADPGSFLVATVRAELRDMVSIEAIPGPSSLTAALSIGGLSGDNFLFLGFLPHKKGRETLFKEIAASERAVIFYESPHRILKTLDSLQKHAGDERSVIIAREMTKLHEQVVTGSPS